jgi:hypothetical protein
MNHNVETNKRHACFIAKSVASKAQGVIRDCPVRLRLKYRVHEPE